jgi:hypothetical protein
VSDYEEETFKLSTSFAPHAWCAFSVWRHAPIVKVVSTEKRKQNTRRTNLQKIMALNSRVAQHRLIIYMPTTLLYCDITSETETMEKEKTASARKRLGKKLSAVTNQHTTIEELLKAVFSVCSAQRLHSED